MGNPNTPTTFSIILSATWSFNVCEPASRAARSSSVRAVRSRSASMRAPTLNLKKFGIRDPELAGALSAVMDENPLLREFFRIGQRPYMLTR